MNHCMFQMTCTAANNQEFREWLKKRDRVLLPFPVIGALALCFGLLNEWQGWIENSWMNGVFSGMGCGLLAVAVVLALRSRKVQKDEEKLRKMRLEYTDERNRSISQSALAATGYITLLVCWVGICVSGWFSKQVFWCFYGMLFFIVVAYLLCRAYYSKKM